jgi:signal peptidase I
MAYRVAEPRRGDIVALSMDADAVLVKRVIGLPGERVRIDNGVVMIDDGRLDEPYIHGRAAWNVNEVTLGDGEYYVIGDNRRMAVRNHTFGVVSRARLFGRLMF